MILSCCIVQLDQRSPKMAVPTAHVSHSQPNSTLNPNSLNNSPRHQVLRTKQRHHPKKSKPSPLVASRVPSRCSATSHTTKGCARRCAASSMAMREVALALGAVAPPLGPGAGAPSGDAAAAAHWMDGPPMGWMGV